MNKQNIKNSKGITLVALIITIVVLLILAIVAIGAVRDSKIIQHAQDAGDSYTIAQEKEQLGLAVSEYQIQKTIDGDAESLFYDIVREKLKNSAEVTTNGDKTILTVIFRKTGNVYTVDKNGNIASNKNGGNEDSGEVIGDFELTVTQTNSGYPVQGVRLSITPIIPESWKHVYTYEERDLAAKDIANYVGARNSDGTEVTNLEQLIIAAANKIEEVTTPFTKDQFEDVLAMLNTMPDVNITTVDEAFAFMMTANGLDYTTVQEWATDVSYLPIGKSLKIRKNSGEWQDITNDAEWLDNLTAEYLVATNGTYEIQIELDDKKSSTKVTVTDISYLGRYVKFDADGDGTVTDETIMWRVLRDDSNKVELITANVLGTGEDGIETLKFGGTDVDEARNEYNNAVTTIVEKCREITGMSNVRSIGGPAVDTTVTVDFEEIARTTDFKPTVDITSFNKYEGDNGLKIGDDSYYLEDYNQMQIARVYEPDNREEYWFAYRGVFYDARKLDDFRCEILS